MTKLRILAVTDRAIYPPTDGETYAMAGQVSELSRHGDVDVLYVRRPDDVTDLDGLRKHQGLQRLVEARTRPFPRRVVRVWGEFSRGRPYFLVPPCSEENLGIAAPAEGYNVLYTGLPRLLGWQSAVTRLLSRHCLRIVCVNDAITERFRFHGGLARLPLPWTLRARNLALGLRSAYFGRLERRLLSGQDVILVQSERDRAAIERDCGAETAARVVVFPNGHKPDLLRIRYEPANPKRLLYLGTVGAEEFGLVEWFLNRVLLPLRQVVAGVEFEVIGGISPKYQRNLERSSAITVRGFVPDLAQALSGNCMMVCPSFMRGGLLNKVLDSMTAGVPCSGIGAFNGFAGFENEVHGFSVDSAEQWVQVLKRVLHAPEHLARVSVRGRELAMGMSWDANASGFRRRLEELLADGPRRAGKHAEVAV